MNKRIKPQSLDDKELQEAIAHLKGYVNLRRWKGNLYGDSASGIPSGVVIPRWPRDGKVALGLLKQMPGYSLVYESPHWILRRPDGWHSQHYNVARLISEAWYWENQEGQS